MKRYLREDVESTMADSQRQIGTGTTQPSEMIGIAPSNTTNGQLTTPRDPKKGIPFELDRLRETIFEIIEKLINVRNQLSKAKDNPSVKGSKRVGLSVSIKLIDRINSLLMWQLPDNLRPFDN